jgi:hypothetical protein
MGNQPFGKLPEIIQAARRGDPRATQMLTRVRKAIDDALGKHPDRARRAKSPTPPIQTGFRLVKPTAKLKVVELDAAGNVHFGNAQAVKKAEIARRKAEVHKAHADMVRREKIAKAHYKKLERTAKAKRKAHPKDEYARVKKLIAESERLQEEIRRLRAELGAQRR